MLILTLFGLLGGGVNKNLYKKEPFLRNRYSSFSPFLYAA